MTEPAPVGDDPSFVPVHRCRSCDQLRDANQALTAENARLREALEAETPANFTGTQASGVNLWKSDTPRASGQEPTPVHIPRDPDRGKP